MSSAGPFAKRRWSGQRRSQITEADLAAHGLSGVSLDRSHQIATGLPPGARRIASTTTTTVDTLPARPAAPSIKGNTKLWTHLQTVSDGRTTKSTRARQIGSRGVVLNTCTRGPAGIAEALVYIPDATLEDFTT